MSDSTLQSSVSFSVTPDERQALEELGLGELDLAGQEDFFRQGGRTTLHVHSLPSIYSLIAQL